MNDPKILKLVTRKMQIFKLHGEVTKFQLQKK